MCIYIIKYYGLTMQNQVSILKREEILKNLSIYN